MVPSDADGTDGSSIKPVSSLRSHFENMNKIKANEAPSPSSSAPSIPTMTAPPIPPHPVHPATQPPATQPPTTTATATQTAAHATAPHPVIPPRPFSPYVRATDRPKEGAETAVDPPPLIPPPLIPPPVPRDRPSVASIQSITGRDLSRAPSSPLSPRPVRPPSFMIQPPMSPSKPSFGAFSGDAIAQNPDAAAPAPSALASSSPSTTPKPFGRTHSPGADARRSPALTSNPPSPPPPRRSTELRREREAVKTATMASPSASAPALMPPTINRLEKPALPVRPTQYVSDESQEPRLITDEVSPFNSPPSSASSPSIDTPPLMSTRRMPSIEPPRPSAEGGGRLPLRQPARLQSPNVAFNPPPIHPSIVMKRREREEEMDPRSSVSPQAADERSAMPLRSLSVTELPPRPPPLSSRPPPPSIPFAKLQTPLGASAAKPAPPPPPRHPLAASDMADEPALSSSPPKRIVSTSAAYQPPPPRLLSRANTVVDRSPDRSGVHEQEACQLVSGTTGFSAARPEAFPDVSSSNRRPPFIKHGTYEISVKSDGRVFSVCGEYVCTSGHFTRVWNVIDGELIMSFSHGDTIKGTAVAFKPAPSIEGEGKRLWIGNNYGELMEADIMTSTVISTKPNAHARYEIIRIYRHYTDLWTLDENGTLHTWGPDDKGTPSLSNEPHYSYKVPKGHTFSMVVGDELWHATGKEIRVFYPTCDGRSVFQPLFRPLIQDGAGEVTAGTMLKSEPTKVLFGHVDGKVSIYSRADFGCLAVVSISQYKIASLTGVGGHLWAAFNSGRIAVFDMNSTPWVVKKEWQAHDTSVVKLVADPASFYKLDRSQVVSLGVDNRIRIWDGLLQDDWLEEQMRLREPNFCDFEQIKIKVMTWNAGASTPNSLRYNETDDAFIRELLQSSGSPDILVFGFQELVDLEDKTATAKRLFKSKKKEGTAQERMSHQYRDWRDCLMKSIDNFMPPDQLYHLIHTSTLVGLFTCIFVKASVRDRIHSLSSGEVKRGMGGLHGNKGAIVIRFVLDDTSMCFINCHLAAGQSHATQRHNDAAAILEASVFPPERDAAVRIDNYVCGGDGSQVLDHELCILNGDLNYRIDTMSRDTVVAAVKAGNLSKLLDRDQLLVARRRIAGFRLRVFEEMPLTFAPTYKYDVGTDNYDTSEKRRSPAWCDRLLYRGSGRLTQLEYRRHEVRVSDHRPVSGMFNATVKRIDQKKRAVSWMDSQRAFEDFRGRETSDEQLLYLTSVCGYDEATSVRLIQQRQSRRAHQSSTSLALGGRGEL